MFVGDRSRYYQPQYSRVVEQEQDAQVRHIQDCFTQLARQPAEKVTATCELLGKLAPQKNNLQGIQEALLKDLASSKKQLKATQEKLEKLVARMRELDLELPKVQEKQEGEGNGERLFRRTFYVLGSATALALAYYGLGRQVGAGLAATAISAAFWALTAGESNKSKKQAAQLEADSTQHKQNIEAARNEENQLKGRINAIMLGVQEAAARANINVAKPGQREEDAMEPIAYNSEEPDERPRYRPDPYDRRASARSNAPEEDEERSLFRSVFYGPSQNNRRPSARSGEDDELDQQQIDFFYNLLRMQNAQRDQDQDDDSNGSDTDEGINLWDQDE